MTDIVYLLCLHIVCQSLSKKDMFLTLLYYHDQDAKPSYALLLWHSLIIWYYFVTMYTVIISYMDCSCFV